MPLAFISRVDSITEAVEAAHQEANRKRNERAESSESEESWEAADAENQITEELESEIFHLKKDYATIGPDGEGFDEIIKSPADLEEVLTAIFSQWTRLQHLDWNTSQIPTFTSTLRSIAAHGSLRTLRIKINACDEDHSTEYPTCPIREYFEIDFSAIPRAFCDREL